MPPRKRQALSAEVKVVGDRIERWRRTRKKRSPMPEELWREAAGLARSEGVYRVSQALGVRYETLRDRTAKGGRRSAKKGTDRFGFVEVALGQAPAGEGVEVELADGSGEKLTVRLGAGSTLDVGALARAWWSRGR